MDLKYIINEAITDKEVKYILKNRLEISENMIKKLKYNGRILLNSVPVHVNAKVNTGDVIDVNLDFDEECDEIIPENINIDILHEDEYMIILNKQPGIVVHPTSYHPTGTIANAIMKHYLDIGLKRKIRPVSRLDRDTSGIIIFAKNEYVQEFLIRQMKDKSFKKEYVGVINGIPPHNKGTIDLPIDRMPGSIMLRHISPSGDKSITHYEVLETLNNSAFLKFNLETGRTHQIRVHCHAIGHPLIGDTLYSDIKTELIERQALHSLKVSFYHPHDRKLFELTAPIPEDIEDLLTQLRT